MSLPDRERILKEASLDPSVVRYHAGSAAAGLVASIVGIVLLPIAIPLTMWYWRLYYDRLSVVLTSRDLKVRRGILNTEEKSIPLEKITDLAVYQGPVMRYFGLKGIRIETAGQSSAGGALVSVVGIEDTDVFRDLVLRQRDRVHDMNEEDTPARRPPAGELGAATEPVRSGSGALHVGAGEAGDAEGLAMLRDIRDTLGRIETALRREGGD